MLQGSSHGEEDIKKPHVCRTSLKTPIAACIRRTSPLAAAAWSRQSALDLQSGAQHSSHTNDGCESSASPRKLAARATLSHLTHPQDQARLYHCIAAAATNRSRFAAGNRHRAQVSAKCAASSPLNPLIRRSIRRPCPQARRGSAAPNWFAAQVGLAPPPRLALRSHS